MENNKTNQPAPDKAADTHTHKTETEKKETIAVNTVHPATNTTHMPAKKITDTPDTQKDKDEEVTEQDETKHTSKK